MNMLYAPPCLKPCIIVFCGVASNPCIIPHIHIECGEYMKIFHGIFSIPWNIVMDLNYVIWFEYF